MKFLDLFSGIGGFRLGMMRNGHTPIGYIEKDKFARKSYEVIYDVKGEWTARDVQKVEPEEIPDFDVLCAGFPCPDFSVAGDREGLEGSKGSLFYEIGRIAKVKRPDYLFLENVRGLLSHDGGRTFGIILKSLGELGYDVEWQVLNSKDFGVPQNRKRVYIIGYLGKKPRSTVFPIRGEAGKSCKRIGRVEDVSGHDILKRVYSPDGASPVIDSMSGGNREPFVIDHGKPKTRKKSTAIDGNYHKGLDNHGQRTGIIRIGNEYGSKGEFGAIYDKKGLSPSIHFDKRAGSTASPRILDQVRPTLTPERLNKRQNGRRFKNTGEPMFTLTGQDRHGVYDGEKVRKLTPKECWRLQGFPDWAYKRARVVNSPTQLYQQAGNAVTVNVVEKIARYL